MPKQITEATKARYAASTSYSDTPPNGTHSITIGSEQTMRMPRWQRAARSFPRIIAAGPRGLASRLS